MVSLGAASSDARTAAELAGMSAWVSAFACQLAGVPIELAKAPKGELVLVSVELEPVAEGQVDAHLFLPSERLAIHQMGGSSPTEAFALGLVNLARSLLEHGSEESKLAELLADALVEHDEALGPSTAEVLRG